MNWVLLVDDDVKKKLKRIPRPDAERVLLVFRMLPSNPYGGDLQKMSGEENVWRRRIGNYRIKLEISSKRSLLYVYELERRTSSTYRS